MNKPRATYSSPWWWRWYETSAYFNENTRRYIPEICHFQSVFCHFVLSHALELPIRNCCWLKCIMGAHYCPLLHLQINSLFAVTVYPIFSQNLIHTRCVAAPGIVKSTLNKSTVNTSWARSTKAVKYAANITVRQSCKHIRAAWPQCIWNVNSVSILFDQTM
jgi:hypothetical protein